MCYHLKETSSCNTLYSLIFRILRGYKMQFVSRDGKYRCMDMDITRTDKETGERLVNINTISQLIYNGTKYIVD